LPWNAQTAGAIGFCGDIVCQVIVLPITTISIHQLMLRTPTIQVVVEKRAMPFAATNDTHRECKAFEWQRTAALVTFNSIYIGGFLHYLFQVGPPQHSCSL
jgi:hypothetical protein